MIGFNIVSRGLCHLWPGTSRLEKKDSLAIVGIRDQERVLSSLADHLLRQRADRLRQVWPATGKPSPPAIAESFALFCESVRRTLGLTLYDVQLAAGLAMARHAVAEMQTGEGKTLAAALPALSYALASRGVHVMTVNDYLAERDFQLLRPAFELLGVSVGLLKPDAAPEQKRAAYACDVTYGPGHEFGFDYLRDQLELLGRERTGLGDKYRTQLRGHGQTEQRGTQRGHFFAVIDEADSVMIDEATTPLVLATQIQPAAKDGDLHAIAMRVADELVGDRDFVVDAANRTVHLTRYGVGQVHGGLDPSSVEQLQRPWLDYIRTALHAKNICQRDVDYVIDDGVVKLVDENTGRIFENRSWRDGLRQAVEACEGIPVTSESETVARISRQRCFMLYEGSCGLTGTACESAREFREVYNLPVIPVPPRTPSRRLVLPPRFFKDHTSKWSAIAVEIERLHATGQPVLVGTRTVKESESLARRLAALGLSPQLLNGVQDAEEAVIIAGAGQRAAITVATNMAGRGTDIQLGPGVAQLGGLHVLVCEPHESARVDRQLIGRAARQGDPGSCQLFASADDHVIAANADELARRIRKSAGANGEAAADYTPELVRIQQQFERRAFLLRRKLVTHDDWLEKIVLQLTRS